MVGFPYCLFDMLTINLVISNVGYLVAGGGFLLLIALTKPKEDGIHGLHTDMSLYYSMGLSIIFTGIFSALYHVCPSNLNFQFGMSCIVVIEKLTNSCRYNFYVDRIRLIIYCPLSKEARRDYYRRFSRLRIFCGIYIFGLFVPDSHPAKHVSYHFVFAITLFYLRFWICVSVVFAYMSWAGSAHLYAQKRVQFTRESILALLLKFKNPDLIGDKVLFP